MAKKKSPKTAKETVDNDIVVHGARTHNLKNVTAAFPRNKLIIVTGVSGSGKSSLTMDTLFAEGQRRYAESLSSYARQFLMRMDKPDVDYVSGICPAIAIEQKVTTRAARSTVGSMTELQDYLRLLYGRAGITYSPVSGEEVRKDEVSDVVDFIKNLPSDYRVLILAPFVPFQNRSVAEEAALLMQKGFTRIFIPHKDRYTSDQILRLEDVAAGDAVDFSKAYILIDRLVVRQNLSEDDLHQMADSVQTAYYESDGLCTLFYFEDEVGTYKTFNNKFEADGITFEVPSPNFFSFNNPYGACPQCEGFGQVLGLDLDLVMPDHRLSVYDDAVVPWRGEKLSQWKKDFIRTEGKSFPIHKPLNDLSSAEWKVLKRWVREFFAMVESNLYKMHYRILQARFRGKTVCPECEGSRLRQDALYVRVGDKNIAELSQMPIEDLHRWFQTVTLTPFQQEVAKRILIEIRQRLDTLMNVGLQYLTLDRASNTLSGGESQRIQLTKFLGSNLTDSMYILDEPSIGLHPRDTDNLIRVLKQLRDLDNTVIIVEHDEMMMRASDHIIDMGPLAAHLGGEVVASGSPEEIIKNKESLTGQYLSGARDVVPQKRPKVKPSKSIKISNCRSNNLKDITVEFPLGILTVVTGVSGSGKTTLVKQTLYPALLRHLGQGTDKPGRFDKLTGDLDHIDMVEMIDQNPIGKSSRSNPVTYIKAYDDIRSIFSSTRQAKIAGFQPKHFSFNVDGGRCDTCKGEGEITVEMQFLADVHLQCESCKGRRFKDEILDIKVQGKDISEVLEMSVDEAILFFEKEKNLKAKLQTLSDVGLGYIKLGQSSNTLSGGEAQRVKLASYLGKNNAQEKVLFIFDEPTTGLHFHDISKLLAAFQALLALGHSLIVIEHNTDVIRNADWIIDIGPEGGNGGGELMYAGIPEGLKKVKASHTARYL